jgi:hypothetical protein
MTESIDKPEPILLKKWQMMEVLSINRNHTACDHAVFWQILDHYNPKLGYAFPPFNRLATRTGFSKRNIENSVNRLVGHGFIEIILHGSQNHVANRYKPNFKLLDDWLEWREKNPNSDLGVWKQSSIGNNLGVWNASSQGMEAQFQSYGSTVPSNPSINPSINEGLIVGLSANATSDAKLASPLGGLPLASKDKYKYPEFWNVYPTRKNVGKTEDEITAMLSDGVLLADIVEGARLYNLKIQSNRASWKGDKDYTIHPQNFVKNRGWLDDMTITPKPKALKADESLVIKTEKVIKVKPKAKGLKKVAPTEEEKAIAKVKREKTKADRVEAEVRRTIDLIARQNRIKLENEKKAELARASAEKEKEEKAKAQLASDIEYDRREIARWDHKQAVERARQLADPKPWDGWI